MSTAPPPLDFGAMTGGSMSPSSPLRSTGAPSSPRGSLRRSGLVSTSSSFFTGPPAAGTLKELAAEPDFVALEAAQRALASRRIALLRRQAELSREAHAALADPSDGMLAHTRRGVCNTQRVIVEAQKRGLRAYYASPPRVAALESGNFLGGVSAELQAIQREIAAGEAEEAKLVAAMAARHPGAAAGVGPRASPVKTLAAWRAAYGAPSGALADASKGYATSWSPTPRYYGTSLPGSGPHGHRSSKLFTGFASDGVDLALGRDFK